MLPVHLGISNYSNNQNKTIKIIIICAIDQAVKWSLDLIH